MVLTPGSPEWCRVVSASKVAAILGHSPFMSQRAVWHLMRGEWQPEVTDAMRRGHYLEDGVLDWWHDQHSEELPEMTRDVSCPLVADGVVWATATLDAIACPRPYLTERDYLDERGLHVIVEAKTSSSDDEWGRPGTDEIPTHYLTQAYWQMHVSGIHECRVPVLTSRLVFAEYVVHHDVEIGQLLEARCREFYDSLDSDPPPPLDDSVSTFECMKQLHPDIEPGETVDVPLDLAVAFSQAALDGKDAERREREARSALYDLAGRAQYLRCNGVLVARRQPKGESVSLVRVISDPDDLTDKDAA